MDILKLAGFHPELPWKLVRHQDPRYPVEELIRRKWFELYQSYQRRPVFHSVKQIVSFYGMTGTRAGFYGVYRVVGHTPGNSGHIPDACPWASEWNRNSKFFYLLRRDPRFDGLRERLVIDWGRATRSWVQRPANKRVLEIREPGRRLRPFEDYLEFSLSYSELCDLFADEEAHHDWKARLSAVGGIYLILAEKSGEMYVGSASGEEGFWGRWRQYANTGHGGNVLLRKIIERDSSYPRGFRYSVLQILPKTMALEEILRREKIYKTKLGSRAKGLNSN